MTVGFFSSFRNAAIRFLNNINPLTLVMVMRYVF